MSFFVNECFVCEATDSPTPCSRCYMISYCGPDHQKEDWPMHQEFCDAVWSVMREKKVSHIYESLSGVDLDTWIKERKRMCWTVKSKLRRDLLLQEEQMLLMPRSCFVCHDTRQDFLSTCTACFCANFCAKHPSSFEHKKDCRSLKLFREFDGKMQDPAKLRTIFTLIDKISDTARFEDSSEVPHSMKEFLNQQIKGKDYRLEQACASNILSMSLTLFNAVKKLNLQSASEILLHIRCDVTDCGIWELLLHFLQNLKVLNIVFIEQRESRKLEAKLCSDCVSKKKKMILETNDLVYKNYIKVRIYKKPDIFAYLNAEISKNDDGNVEWKFLLESLSRIGVPVVLTSVTETMAKILAKSLKSTFWPSLICYEGPNDFGALEPLREWTDGGVSRINQLLIITKGRTTLCMAGFFHNSSWLTKKRREDLRSSLVDFYTNVCIVCRSQDISTFCKFCNMIFYCSEPHRKEDWSKHREMCQAIQRLLKKSGMKSIFDGEIDLMGSKKTDPESWLRAKVNLISKAESQLGKKLWVYQQQMFLFPKTCFVCHEGELSKLKGCECGIHLCKKHNDSPHHKQMCEDFQLSLQLFEKERIPEPLPKYKYVPGVKEHLPGSIEEFIDSHLELESEAAAEKTLNYNRVVIGELLTKPLTLLYAIQKLMIPEFRNEHDSENNSTFVVHVIGSKNAANVYYEFWDVFFNWMQNLETLNVSFVGPETANLNFNRTFSEVKEKNLSIKSYPLDYEQFVQSSFFIKPDIVVGYNLDIHECEIEACSCRENLLTVRKLNVPFVMTSGSKERAQKDHDRASKVLESSVAYDFCNLNPFASLVPERDFETEGLRFSNKYLLMYCNLDQPDVQNSKLRKYLLESLEAKRLADVSHLSELEKALRAMQIESAPISSIESAETKTKAPIPKNSFLFNAAKDELRYMLRNLRRGPKSDVCKNSGSKTDSGAKDEKLSTEESESKSEPGSAKNNISEKNLSSKTLDSEQKSESEPALDEIFEENVLSATEDSEKKLESGSATLQLFKDNVFSTSQYSECTPELGTQNIWNELFEDNILPIEDSVSELKSGYAKVEIAKNLKSTAGQDFESKLEFENENILSTTENRVLKLELESVTEIKKNFLFTAEYSQPKSESGSTKDLVEQDLLLKLSTTESSENLLFTKDYQSKLKSGSSNVEISMDALFSTIENSESNSESESLKKEILKEILKENPLFSTQNAEHKPESESANLERSKDLFTTVDFEFKPKSESANFEILKDLLPITEDTEHKSESGSVEDLVIQTLLLKLSTAESLEYDLETGSSKEIEDSKSKSESVNVQISKEDPLPTIEISEFKLETVPPMDESFKENVLATANFQSESRPANLERSKDLFTTVDSEFKPESESTNFEILKDLLSITEDTEHKSESGSIEDLVIQTLLLKLPTAEGLEYDSETGSSKEIDDSKSKLESLNVQISEEDLLPTIEISEFKLETVPPMDESFKDNVLANENFQSESRSDKPERSKDLFTTVDSKFRPKAESANFEILKDLLSITEDIEHKAESGSVKDVVIQTLSLKLPTAEGLEYVSETGSSKEIEGTKSKSESVNVQISNEDTLPTIEISELKLETVPLIDESFKENVLATENFQSESRPADTIIDLEEHLSSLTEDFASDLESVFAKVETVSVSISENSVAKPDFGYDEGLELKLEIRSADTTLDLEEYLSSLTEDLASKSESGSANVETVFIGENSVDKPESGSASDETVSTSKVSASKSESELNNVEIVLISENSAAKSESEYGEDLEFNSESASPSSETVKEDLLTSTEDSVSESETVFETFMGNLLPDSEEDESETESESGSLDDDSLKEKLLLSTEDSESKSESDSANVEILKGDLFSTIEDSESKESGFANGETLKKDLLPNAEEFEIKYESGSASNIVFKSESGSPKEEISKENLLSTENSESKAGSFSVSKSKSGDEKDGIFIKSVLLIPEQDLESKSESRTINCNILKDDSESKESEFVSGDILKKDLLSTSKGSESKASEFVYYEKLKEDLLSSSKDSESKSENVPPKDKLLQANLLPNEDFESESGLAKNTLDLGEYPMSLNEESSAKLEPGPANVQTVFISENSVAKSESRSTNGETLKEDLLSTTENSEPKSESGSVEDFLMKDFLFLSDNENFMSKVEDSESRSDNIETLKEDLLSGSEGFQYKLESVSLIDKILKEDLFLSSEDSESKFESEYEIAEVEKLEENLLTIEETETKSVSNSVNFETLMDDLLTTDDFESKLGSECFKEVLLITENLVSKAEFDSVKDKISRKNLLPSEEQDFESKSESESVNSEALKNNFMPPTNDDSESKSESASAKDELFKENVLPTTEDFESKSECGAKEEKLKDLVKSESEFSKEIEDSVSLSKPGSAVLEIFEDILSRIEDHEPETESASATDDIFKKILLLVTEDFQVKSESGTGEEKLKEDLSSTTGDSECESESRPTKKELLIENLLLKEEMRRLKENEELMNSENSRLKEELCRLRKV